MRILIVDDEPMARQRLHELVGKLRPMAVIDEAENGEQAVHMSAEKQFDIVLLDIRMPIMDGMQVASYLMTLELAPAVIFTTAYDEYALEAFEVDAVDYLLKPVRKDRLDKALTKAERLLQPRLREGAPAASTQSKRNYISVISRGRIELIPLSKVIYFMADNKYIQVCTAEKRYLIEGVLNDLEEEFSDRFLRVHRNALIAMDSIQGLEKNKDGKWFVKLKNINDQLNVSRRRVAAVRRWSRGR